MLKSFVKQKLLDKLLIKPSISLVVDNLYTYLHAIEKTNHLHSPVIEIGCAHGHTSTTAANFLARRGSNRNYYVVDTFGGFTTDHINFDVEQGFISKDYGSSFRDVALNRVKSNFQKWGCPNISIVKGDICKLNLSELNKRYSVALVDVDLFKPCYEALDQLFELMEEDGIILVDDVVARDWDGADAAYREFCDYKGIQKKYFGSFGIIARNIDHFKFNDVSFERPQDTKYNFNPKFPIKLLNGGTSSK